MQPGRSSTGAIDANHAVGLFRRHPRAPDGRHPPRSCRAAAAARHEQLVRVLATGERVRYEAEFRERALLITLFRIDANTVGSEAFDITELRRGELALRASEARYHMLFDSIDEGFCIIEVVFDERGKPIDYRFVEEPGVREADGARRRRWQADAQAGAPARGALVPDLRQGSP